MMRYRVFTYPVPPPEQLDELNGFLASGKILSVRSEVCVKNGSPYLLFIVEYLESGRPEKERLPKVDYREKLSDTDFQAFSMLRDLRRTIAEREGVPVYAVLTNAQLAEMVENRIHSLQDMLQVPGIGQGKLEKYGKEFVDLCKEILPVSEKEAQE